MKIALILLSCLVLSACASTEPPPPEPTRYAFTLGCKGSVVAWADCYAQHGALCDEAGRVSPEKL